ncbi:MAG TPA: hypothetical protein PLG90_01655 [Ignavibacteria bacterium]|nr:hypothetical protein [Ignavibacteria bacterium]
MKIEKIDISFDDEEFSEKEKIEINLSDEDNKKSDAEIFVKEKLIIADNFEEAPAKIITPTNSFHFANQSCNKYYDVNIQFPTGLESGFRKKFSVDTGFEFFTDILTDSKNIILTASTGEIIFISKNSGRLSSVINTNGEYIEKTGLVYEEKIFISTLNSLFECTETNLKSIYKAEEGYYIWTNLNLTGESIIFGVYSENEKKFKIILYDIKEFVYSEIYEGFAMKYFGDSMVVNKSKVYVKADKSLIVIDFSNDKNEIKIEILETPVENEAYIMSNNTGIVMADKKDVYFLNIVLNEKEFKYTGISCYEINSIAGYGDRVFTGTGNGWSHYKISGVSESNTEDIAENIIQALNQNVISISRKNKIIFYNLNKIQEAEGFIISSENVSKSQEIISVIYDNSHIYVLTDNGILTCFSNDKLNIHI